MLVSRMVVPSLIFCGHSWGSLHQARGTRTASHTRDRSTYGSDIRGVSLVWALPIRFFAVQYGGEACWLSKLLITAGNQKDRSGRGQGENSFNVNNVDAHDQETSSEEKTENIKLVAVTHSTRSPPDHKSTQEIKLLLTSPNRFRCSRKMLEFRNLG